MNMGSRPAKTIKKGPAARTEEPVKDSVGTHSGGGHDKIMGLQRDAGNQAVSKLLVGSSGRPLDPGTREEMEAKFGADFGDVRIHNDAAAAETALNVGARAITSGHEIAFGPGFYDPAASDGKRLIAHELAHVVQQRGEGREVSGAAAELEARQAGADVAAGHVASVTGSASASAQLQPMSLEEQRKLIQRQIVFGGQTPGPLAPKAPPQALADVPGQQKQTGQEDKKPNALTDAATKFTDAAKKDPILAGFRNKFSKWQPFVPEKDMKKALNDALDAGLKEGTKQAIKAGVEAASGQKTNELDSGMQAGPSIGPQGGLQIGPQGAPQAGPQVGPYTPFRPDIKPVPIIKTPEIPIPDTPDVKPSFRFQYKRLRASYAPGESMDLTVVPPVDYANIPGPRLTIVPMDPEKAGAETKFPEVHLDDSMRPKSVELTAPTKPGKYLLRVKAGFGVSPGSEEEFQVTEEKKGK
jgi:hypothetical protein